VESKASSIALVGGTLGIGQVGDKLSEELTKMVVIEFRAVASWGTSYTSSSNGRPSRRGGCTWLTKELNFE